MPQNPSTTTGCITVPELFQHPLLEEPPTPSAPADLRHRYEELERAVEKLCHGCPLRQPCLYRAVVQHDVAGYAAGTTQRERTVIRTRLGVVVEPEDLDTLAGVTRNHRQVDHDEVVRIRRSNPDETLEQLAHRLGCSLSTVKRHLRHERQSSGQRPRSSQGLPSPSQVMAAYAMLGSHRGGRDSAAA